MENDDVRQEINHLLMVSFPGDVGAACIALVEIVCPLMVSNSVSVDHAQHDLRALVDQWFSQCGAEAGAHFKSVQPKAD